MAGRDAGAGALLERCLCIRDVVGATRLGGGGGACRALVGAGASARGGGAAGVDGPAQRRGQRDARDNDQERGCDQR